MGELNSASRDDITGDSGEKPKNVSNTTSAQCKTTIKNPEHLSLDEFKNTVMEIPQQQVQTQFFDYMVSEVQLQSNIQDLILAHKVIDSGVPNRFGCRILLCTQWNTQVFEQFLLDYQEREIIDWITYGFPIARDDNLPDPVPAKQNHLGATLFPSHIDAYIKKETELNAVLGLFSIPPFLNRIGISPLSTRPKRESSSRRVILDLSFPQGHSVNDGILKDRYCGEYINLSYPTIDTLAQRVVELGPSCLLWKKDAWRAFRQIPLCPRDYSLIGYHWNHGLYFDKVMPMGLHTAAYICQRITNAVVFVHRQLGYWSINYLDDFGSAEKPQEAWDSYHLMGNILKTIGLREAEDKAVPPTTCMDFLSNTVDTVKMTLEVSEGRREELLQLISKWKLKKSYAVRQLQSLIGKLSFVTNCVHAGCIFIARLIDQLKELKDNSDRHPVTIEMIKDLTWWEKFLPQFDGVSILWLQDCLSMDQWLAMDASLIGVGVYKENNFSNTSLHLMFSQTQNIFHSWRSIPS